MRVILMTSLMTGGFCAVFAGVVDAITDALTMWQVIGLGALSGTLVSLFAQLVLRRGRIGAGG